MTKIRTLAAGILSAGILLALAGTASAAPKRGVAPAAKKLYCWEENGHKVCGDALPTDATSGAHTEFSTKSGRQTGTVGRALSADELAAAALSAQQAQAAADAEAARARRDLAMVQSYASEADLRRAYGERISLLDDSIKASALGEANLRASLTSLLNQAGDLELAGKPVPPGIVAGIRSQHVELQKQQRILAQQHLDRAGLDDELNESLTRYRQLKQPAGTVSPAAPQPPAPGG